MIEIMNNSRTNTYLFEPENGSYKTGRAWYAGLKISGIGWEYRRIPFGRKHFAAIYCMGDSLYLQHGIDIWEVNENAKFKWKKKLPLILNQFDLVLDGEIKFKQVYFEPALREPLNFIDFFTYDEFDAWADDFYYSLSTNGNMAEWIKNVKENWKAA